MDVARQGGWGVLRALASVNLYIDIGKRKLLWDAIFNAHFNYCLFIWMLHGRWNNVATIKRSNTYMEDVSDLCTITNTLLTKNMKDVFDLCTITNTLLTKNFHKKKDQFLSTIKIFKTLLRGQKHLSPRDSKIYFCWIKWKPLWSSKPKWFQMTSSKSCLSQQWEHLLFSFSSIDSFKKSMDTRKLLL